jgi:enoyl-CoA hydratase/carnithine racemase
VERVTVEINEGVAQVILNRPDKYNALDMPMFRAIVAAGRSLAERRDVRVVVLHGRGKSFCSGLDVASVMAGGPETMAEMIDHKVGPANLVQQVAWVWREMPQPVIAALHGHVYGGGLQIALGADIRLVTPDAKVSVLEIVWGLIPDMAITQTLLPWVRRDVLKELTFTGRTITGQQAAELGLMTRVEEDPVKEALLMAREIVDRNPHAVQAAKKLYDTAATMSPEDSFALELELQRGVLGSPNQMEASMARLQRRKPNFSDPE